MSNNIYLNLLMQAEKLRRHTRAGSYKTRVRYYEGFKRFLRYLAENWRLQKIVNIAPKHVVAYVEHMQDKNLSAATIKTELSAVRFFHDQIPNAKYTLPSNNELELERRKIGGVDRTWSNREFNLMLSECMQAHEPIYEGCLVLARYAGLRIHEILRIDSAIARNAVKTGLLKIKGKNGRIRQVPINASIRIELEKFLKITPPGCKIFVPINKQTHIVKAELQKFIIANRKFVKDPDSTRPLTIHGLRHTCAAEWYINLKKQGKSDYEAKKQISQWLGHNRIDVVDIYLAGIYNDDKPGEYWGGGDHNV